MQVFVNYFPGFDLPFAKLESDCAGFCDSFRDVPVASRKAVLF